MTNKCPFFVRRSTRRDTPHFILRIARQSHIATPCELNDAGDVEALTTGVKIPMELLFSEVVNRLTSYLSGR